MAQQQISGHEVRQRVSWGIGLALGLVVGMALGTTTDNLALGLVGGVAVGVAVTVAIVSVDNRALRREHTARVAQAEADEAAHLERATTGAAEGATDATPATSFATDTTSKVAETLAEYLGTEHHEQHSHNRGVVRRQPSA